MAFNSKGIVEMKQKQMGASHGEQDCYLAHVRDGLRIYFRCGKLLKIKKKNIA